MFENFANVVKDGSFNDDQVETFFWIITEDVPDKVNEALELLGKHRNILAKKIAKTFLEVLLEKQ